MGHRDYSTTQRYINMARQLNPTIQNLHVPSLPKKEEGAARERRKRNGHVGKIPGQPNSHGIRTHSQLPQVLCFIKDARDRI